MKYKNLLLAVLTFFIFPTGLMASVCDKKPTEAPAFTGEVPAAEYYHSDHPRKVIFTGDSSQVMTFEASRAVVWDTKSLQPLRAYFMPNRRNEKNSAHPTIRWNFPEYVLLSNSGKYAAFSFSDEDESCTDIYEGKKLVKSIDGLGLAFSGEQLVVLGSGEKEKTEINGKKDMPIYETDWIKTYDIAADKFGKNQLNDDFATMQEAKISPNGTHIVYWVLDSSVYGGDETFWLFHLNTVTGKAKMTTVKIPAGFVKDTAFFVDNDRVYRFGSDLQNNSQGFSMDLNTGESKIFKYTAAPEEKVTPMGALTVFHTDKSLRFASGVDGSLLADKQMPDITPNDGDRYFFISPDQHRLLKHQKWSGYSIYTTLPMVYDLEAKKYTGTLQTGFAKKFDYATELGINSEAHKKFLENMARQGKAVGTDTKPKTKEEAFIAFVHKYGPNPTSLQDFNYDVGVYCQYRGPRCHEYRVMYQKMEREYNARAEAANMRRIWEYTQSMRPAGVSSEERSRCLQKLTESINRHTYAKQDWHFDLNMCN